MKWGGGGGAQKILSLKGEGGAKRFTLSGGGGGTKSSGRVISSIL